MEISTDTSTIYTPVGKIGGRSYIDGAEKYIFSFYSIPYATFPSKFSNCTEFTSGDVTSQYRGTNDYKDESSTRHNNQPIIINRYLPTFCMNYHFSRHFSKNQKRKTEEYATKDAIVSDSCLTLDIFVQGRFLEFSADLAPVIVIFDDPKADFESYTLNKLPTVIHLTTYTDSLIVRVNYRNGPLGFLYLDEEHFPGNYGLIDQRQALKWIRANIDNFGGDKDQVTILGQGLGAIGSAWHLEHSQGLFNKLVLLSGSPYNLFSSWDPGLLKSLHHRFISSFDCEKFKSLRYCIEELTDQEIYSVTQINELPSQLFFLPHHDLSSFLTRESRKNSSFVSTVDIMVGYQKKDGFVLYDELLDEEFSFLSLVNLSLPEDLLKIVSFEYSHHHISVENPTEEDFNTFMSDYFIIAPQYKFASEMSNKLRSRVYMFTADIPFAEDQAESDSNVNESDFLGSNLLESSVMQQKFSQFVQVQKALPSRYFSPKRLDMSGTLSGLKSSTVSGDPLWKSLNFSETQFSCQILGLVKSNRTGYTALFVEKTPKYCEPHFSRFWNEVVFQSLDENIDYGKEAEIDDEYGDDGTFNETTEGLNETEVPPSEKDEEEEEEEGGNGDDSSGSQDGDKTNYEAQLKNLQVSLRYEKLRFTVSVLGLGIAVIMMLVMCILFCYCMGFKKRVKNCRTSRKTSSSYRGCSSLLRSQRSFRSELCSTPTTLHRRDSMTRYDVITPLHGFPPAGDEAYQMAKLDRYQAERSTTTTPTMMRSANTYIGPTDCDVIMRQVSQGPSGEDNDVARRLSEHLFGHRVSNTFAWLPSPFKSNSPEPNRPRLDEDETGGLNTPKMIRPSIPPSESRSTDSSGYGGGGDDVIKFGGNAASKVSMGRGGFTGSAYPSTELTDSLMAGEYKL